MEQAIIVMLGVIITLMLYLHRCRRADISQLKNESRAQREETQREFAAQREETRAGFDKLTGAIVDLVGRVGRLEGRFEGRAESAEAS